jgi:rhamnopyranosyl-N-acetylglucosaminyl-diphospho-decaprenol beta-1,3/1,4-galactofuranosyltransferase
MNPLRPAPPPTTGTRPPPSGPRVAAVFATMNRAATATGCLRALAAQTRPPDLIVVADNVSSDGTAAVLEAERVPGLTVIRMPANAGNAGGVAAAMDHAFAAGADAVWILDDDSWPAPEALAALLAGNWRPDQVRHSLQIRPGETRFTWPLDLHGPRGGWLTCDDLVGLPSGTLLPSRGSWTGALVPRQVREAAGPVVGGLFIRGEDEDYPLRINRAGFGFAAVPASLLSHPGPADLRCWSLFGKRLYLERGLAPAKVYYKVRNMVWIRKEHFGRISAAAIGAAYAAGILAVDGWSKARLRLLAGAIADGWHGRLGPWRGP